MVLGFPNCANGEVLSLYFANGDSETWKAGMVRVAGVEGLPKTG